MQNKKRFKVHSDIVELWKCEIEKGKPHKLYSMISLINDQKWLERVSPTEVFEHWYTGIQEEYRFLVDEIITKIVNDTVLDESEIVYPWTDDSGKTEWLRTGGRIYKRLSDKIIIMGYHQKISEISILEYSEYIAEYLVNVQKNNVTLRSSSNDRLAICRTGESIDYDYFQEIVPLDLLSSTEKINLKDWLEVPHVAMGLGEYSARSIIYQNEVHPMDRYMKLTAKATRYENGVLREFLLSIKDIDDSVRRRERALFLTKAIANLEYLLKDEEIKLTLEEKNSKNLINHFHSSLQNEEFEVYYQPKYDPTKRLINGAEALVRWNFKKKQLISPIEFIPEFEKNGYIIELDKYVWRKACEYINKHNLDILVSVNVSMRHLEDPEFKAYITKLVKEYDIDPGRLCLEFTETAHHEDIKYIYETLIDLQDKGLKLSLDDFGAGYSSLTLLKDIPVHEIKIDKSLVNSLAENEKASFILETIAMMSHKLNVHTVVEGVETNEQLKILKQLGFNTIQGYLFSRPLPEDDFIALLKETNTEPLPQEEKRFINH